MRARPPLLHVTSEPVTRCKREDPLSCTAVWLLQCKLYHTDFAEEGCCCARFTTQGCTEATLGREGYTSSRCHKVALQARAGWHCTQQLRDHVCRGLVEQQVLLSGNNTQMRPTHTVGSGKPCCIWCSVLTLRLWVPGLQDLAKGASISATCCCDSPSYMLQSAP